MNHRHLGTSGLVVSEIAYGMAQLAVAWVLQHPNVSAAIVGASRPEQLEDSARAAGVKLDAEVLKRIDQALGEAVVRDPQKTRSPARRP